MNNQNEGKNNIIEMNQAEKEITLIDLAKIVVRRRNWFYAVSFSVFLLGATFGMLRGDLTDYRTYYYSVSTEEQPRPHITKPRSEPVKDLLSNIEDVYLDRLKRKYISEGRSGLPFGIEMDQNQKSKDYFGLHVTIKTTATPGDKEEVAKFHRDLVEIIQREQDAHYESRRKSWTRQKEEARIILSKMSQANSAAVQEQLDIISRMEINLENAKPGYVQGLADPIAGRSKKNLIIFVSFFGAIGLGILAVFVVEFIQLVKFSLEEDKKKLV